MSVGREQYDFVLLFDALRELVQTLSAEVRTLKAEVAALKAGGPQGGDASPKP